MVYILAKNNLEKPLKSSSQLHMGGGGVGGRDSGSRIRTSYKGIMIHNTFIIRN